MCDVEVEGVCVQRMSLNCCSHLPVAKAAQFVAVAVGGVAQFVAVALSGVGDW